MHLNLFTTIHLSDSNNYYHTKLILLGKDHKLVYTHSLLLCGMQSKKKGRRRKRPFGSLQKDVKTEHIHVSVFSSMYIMVQTLKTGKTKKKQRQVSTQTFCRC